MFELKHDGYRLMVRKDDERVRIYTRRGVDWTAKTHHMLECRWCGGEPWSAEVREAASMT